MSKFKVGDKVKRTSEVGRFKSQGGTDSVHEVTAVSGSDIKLDGVKYSWWGEVYFELAQDEWTIYSNDKPLNELTDEQVGKLVKHSGSIETFDGSFWCTVEPQWSVRAVYRAKQKSERELFIDAAIDAMQLHKDDLAKHDIGKMFDAGFKAHKDGE